MGTIIVFGIFIIVAFTLGIVLGQKLSKGEEIKVNPVEIVQDHIEETKVRKENKINQEELEKMLHNIDNYDGSSLGQLEVRGNK